MKTNERRIRTLLKMFKDIELFYVISIGIYSNTLQAKFNSELVLELKKLKFISTGYDVNGYAHFVRGNITVVLT